MAVEHGLTLTLTLPLPLPLTPHQVRCQLDVLVEKLGLSVEELVENAWVHKAQEHLPLDDLATPYDAAQDFIEACAAETRRTLTLTPDPTPTPTPNL